MKGVRKKIFPYHLEPGSNLFHVVVSIRNEPGSLSSVLSLLAKRLDLIGTSSYDLDEKNSIFSAFGRALSPLETKGDLKKLLEASPTVIESTIEQGEDGLIIDMFHDGIETSPGQVMMMIPRGYLAAMFHGIVKQFGSGGKTILYDQGLSVGKANANFLAGFLGPERVKMSAVKLSRLRAAFGWGDMRPVSMKWGESATIQIDDCFECSEANDTFDGCHFWRGFLAGAVGHGWGTALQCVETKCRGRGDDLCEFELTKKAD